jgi:hypothetical protein
MGAIPMSIFGVNIVVQAYKIVTHKIIDLIEIEKGLIFRQLQSTVRTICELVFIVNRQKFTHLLKLMGLNSCKTNARASIGSNFHEMKL